MRRLLPLLAALGLITACSGPPNAKPKVAVTPLTNRVRVEFEGQFFTDFVWGDGASRPYCYPILAADGLRMTRDFPVRQTPGEETDHPWHRSLWFAHSMVNGVDFWNEGTGGKEAPKAKGRTVVDAITETRSGDVGVIRAHVKWLAPGGRLVCTDDRTLRFHASAAGRFIDYEVTLHAPAGEPVLLGDNKDGTMALRLAQWMTLPHKYQGREVPGAGHIVTSTGARDADAWGKRADWCDYYAPHEGKVYGVAIFDSPRNLRHPTWWMARDYGLFGANPFGRHDYENLKDQPHAGDYTIPAGGSLTLRYRFFFHEGDTTTAGVAARYAEYRAGR
ncbi:MAG TPA: PmoA family protein [Lacunisphaera sp.]|nr:PmoA family protein [Lacunisphaera sp.]